MARSTVELKGNGDALRTSGPRAGERQELDDGTLKFTSRRGVSKLDFSKEKSETAPSERGRKNNAHPDRVSRGTPQDQ